MKKLKQNRYRERKTNIYRRKQTYSMGIYGKQIKEDG